MLSLFIKENNPEKAGDYSYHEGNQSAKSDYCYPCKYFQCQSRFFFSLHSDSSVGISGLEPVGGLSPCPYKKSRRVGGPSSVLYLIAPCIPPGDALAGE